MGTVNAKTIKNSLLLIFSQITARLIGFAYFIFLAKKLSVADFGVFNWVLGLVYNFLPVADFGLERYILKHLPRQIKKAKSYYPRLLTLKMILGTISFLLAIALGLILGASGEKLLILTIFSLHLIPYGLVYTTITFKNAQEKVELAAIFNIAYSLAGAILGIGAIKFGLGLRGVFSGYLLAAVSGFFLINIFDKEYRSRFIWDSSFFKKVVRESWVFALLVILSVFYLRLPLLVINKVRGDYETGLYGAVNKFLEAGILIPQALVLALAPSYSRLLKEKRKEELKKVYYRDLVFILPLAVFSAAVIFFAAKPIIIIFLGAKYLPAKKAFSFLGLAIGLIFLNSLFSNIIENSLLVKKYLIWTGIKFLLVLGSGFWLIPKFGLVGGALMMIGGEVLSLVSNFIFFRVFVEGYK